MTTKVYLGIGANLGDTEKAFDQAISKLHGTAGEITKVSSFYRARAHTLPGESSQQEYLNACAECRTDLSPHKLIKELHEIERSFGRNRVSEKRWAPRAMDLDILLYGESIIDEDSLVIPHPRLHERDFVMVPLNEIAPTAYHPLFKKTIAALLQEFNGERYLIDPA